MVSKYSGFLAVFFCLISLSLQAQKISRPISELKVDSVQRDSAKLVKTALPVDTVVLTVKKDVRKALWMGAIIPGYGQILNKKYWKLPLVYGGFVGFAYAISWNSSQYSSYQTAYRDITDNDPKTTSYLALLPKGRTVESIGVQQLTSSLKSKQDSFRRYRDLSIFMAIGYYALTLVDAYVDAQLADFDISPNLSMRVQPTMMKSSYGAPSLLGMQCSLSLK